MPNRLLPVRPICALTLSLCLAAAGPVLVWHTAALAGETDTGPTAAATDEPLTHATESVESCMAKWDPGTHMTKEDWRQSCLRIKEEREKYVRDR